MDFVRYHVIVHVDLNLELFEDQTHHSKENLIPDLPVDTFGALAPAGLDLVLLDINKHKTFSFL